MKPGVRIKYVATVDLIVRSRGWSLLNYGDPPVPGDMITYRHDSIDVEMTKKPWSGYGLALGCFPDGTTLVFWIQVPDVEELTFSELANL